MAKHPRPSLEQFAQSATAPTVTQTAKVVDFKPAEMPVQEPRLRKDRPHTTLYLDKKTQKVIKEIALQYDCKPHDLYLEGINLMLAHYGRPSIDEISRS